MLSKLKEILSVWALPCGLVFLASASVMAIEMVAGRMLARYVGASLYLWTSIIGVILGGMTLGNFLGGHIADRFDTRKAIPMLFLFSAILCFALPYMNEWTLLWSRWNVVNVVASWPWRIFKHVFLVFFLPAVCLGLISPVVAKGALEQGFATGRTVGNVYAWGALGSIVGTFATGFFLIKAVGTAGVIYGVAVLLTAVGVALQPRFSLRVLAVTWPLIFGSYAGFTFYKEPNFRKAWSTVNGKKVLTVTSVTGMSPILENILYEDESQYSFMKVVETPWEDDIVRCLYLDNLVHAICVPDEPTKLIYDYEKIYASVTVRYGKDKEDLRGLFLGGGGYVFPRFFQERWPRGIVQVDEIDPAVTKANFEAFLLNPEDVVILEGSALGGEQALGTSAGEQDPQKPNRMEIFHMDARIHVEDLLKLKQTGEEFKPFDFIYGDAFSDYGPPYHLTTKEFVEKVRELLTPETGLYCQNVIEIFNSGRFLGAMYNTLRAVFPHVDIFCTTPKGPNLGENGRDTFIIMAGFHKLDLENLGHREGELPFLGAKLSEKHVEILKERSRGVILTDNYAPVENLLEEVVRRRSQR